MINNLLLKISLTDGCAVAQDMLSILCPTPTPTATITPTPTVTPTMTPTPSSNPASSNDFFFINEINNYTYSIDSNIIAKFIITNSNVSSLLIRVPRVNSSAANILTVSTLLYNNSVVGQFQFDSTRLQPGTPLDISFVLEGSLLTFNNINLTTPRILLN